MTQPLHILLVDENESVRDVIAEQLVEVGHCVSIAVDGETMRRFLDTRDPVKTWRGRWRGTRRVLISDGTIYSPISTT